MWEKRLESCLNEKKPQKNWAIYLSKVHVRCCWSVAFVQDDHDPKSAKEGDLKC